MGARGEIQEKNADQLTNAGGHIVNLNQLYNDHAPTMYGIILKIVKDELIAEDTLAESFLKIGKTCNQFTGSKENLIGWLILLARKTAFEKVQEKHYRSQLLANELYKCKLYLTEGEPCGLYEKVKNAATPLPEESKAILDMLFFEGLTTAQIALKLDMDIEEVKLRVSEAVKLIKDC